MAFSGMKSAIALLCVISASEAWADPWVMMVINSTGNPIKTIQIAPSPASSWSASTSVGAMATLNNGARTTIHFDKLSSTCKFDLRATFSDATSAVYPGINVCDNSYVTLKISNGKPAYTTN